MHGWMAVKQGTLVSLSSCSGTGCSLPLPFTSLAVPKRPRSGGTYYPLHCRFLRVITVAAAEWQYPEPFGVHGAAHEEVHLVGCVLSFAFARRATSQLELIMGAITFVFVLL